jgi:hypothetical protein
MGLRDREWGRDVDGGSIQVLVVIKLEDVTTQGKSRRMREKTQDRDLRTRKESICSLLQSEHIALSNRYHGHGASADWLLSVAGTKLR